MKKRIYKNRSTYNGEDEFYQFAEFNRYMKRQGAEKVAIEISEPNRNYSTIYHLNDVTIKHVTPPNARVASYIVDIEIWLFGHHKKVNALERKIKKASVEYRSKVERD